MNVLPNLFEEFIDIENLKFYAKKIDENRYLGFAYDELKILDSIKNANLNINQIRNIHFGQIELEYFKDDQNSFFIIEDQIFGYIDDILVKIPSSINIENPTKIELNKIELSKDTIAINSSSKYIDNKTAYTISIIFILLALLNFGKYIANISVIDKTPIQIEKIKTDSKMLSTSLQTKSVIKRFKKLYKKQIKLRELLEYILLYKQHNKATLYSIDYKNNKFIFKFKDISTKKIKRYIKKKYKIDSISQKDNIVTIGLSI